MILELLKWGKYFFWQLYQCRLLVLELSIIKRFYSNQASVSTDVLCYIHLIFIHHHSSRKILLDCIWSARHQNEAGFLSHCHCSRFGLKSYLASNALQCSNVKSLDCKSNVKKNYFYQYQVVFSFETRVKR